MMISFKRSHAGTVVLRAPINTAGHHRPTPLLEIPGHSQASLGQSLVGSLLLSPRSWCTEGFCVPSKSLFLHSCVSSGGSMVGLMVTSSKRAYAISRFTATRAPGPAAAYCWPVPPKETLKHSSGSISVGLLGPSVHKVCLSCPSVSGGDGVCYETRFCPYYHLAGTSPLHLEVEYLFLVGSNMLLLTIVQQRVVIWEF